MNRSNHVLFYSEDPNEAWDGSNAVTGEGLHYSSGGEVFAWRIAIKRKVDVAPSSTRVTSK